MFNSWIVVGLMTSNISGDSGLRDPVDRLP
jgi:hypothetical protein